MKKTTSSNPSVEAELNHETQAPIERSRRRLLGGAAGGVGVLMAVSAKTALGTTLCQSPSAMVSGNTSPQNTELPCSGGRSPGFWKQPQKFQYWATVGATPPTFDVPVETCMKGMGDLSLANIVDQGLPLVTTLFPGASVPPGTGIWAVIAFPTSFPGGQLMRHLACAWLNAGLFPDYPVKQWQVTEMFTATASGGVYCPGSISCGPNMGMDADDVIDYISGMYDINADLDNDLCQANNK